MDVTGSREYTLYVKDLQTGALEPDRVGRVASVAWSATPATFFYVTEDHAKRPYRLWRHPLGSVADDLLYEETDELFRLGVARSRSLAYLFLYSASHTTTEARYVAAGDPGGVWTVLVTSGLGCGSRVGCAQPQAIAMSTPDAAPVSQGARRAGMPA